MSYQGEVYKEKSQRSGNEREKVCWRWYWMERGFLFFGGMLYAAAFPEVGWHFLAWVILIPLYWIVKDKRPGQAWRCGYVWGYGFSIASFFWLREIELFIPFAMAAVLALFPAFWAWLVPFLRRYLLVPVSVQLGGYEDEKNYFKPVPFKEMFFVLALGAWWCIVEWVRCWVATGFPWNYMATTQWRQIALIQVVEYTGVYGVSFVIVIVNISFAIATENWYKGFKRNKRYQRPWAFLMSLVILMLTVLFGGLLSVTAIRENKDDIALNAFVLQGNIPQCRQASYQQAELALKTYLDLSDLAVMSKPDVIIWPETAVPFAFDYPEGISKYYQFRVYDMAMKNKVPFLIGSLDFGKVPDGAEDKYAIHHNSALLIDIYGKIKDRYHKVHRVPFGEYVPFGKYFPFLARWIGMGRDLTPGKEFNVIEIKDGVKAGVNICFEDVFPYVSRNQVRNGANILIVLTNDAWYPKSDEPAQHLANSVFRAIENRRPMIRCGNNSCSCLILPTGHIADSMFYDVDVNHNTLRLDLFRKGKGYSPFEVKLKRNPPLTFYTCYGDVFIWLCFLVWGGAMLMALWTWREKKEKLAAAFDK